MKEIIAYECEFCGKKRYKHKGSAKRHEDKCFANPKNKACRTCEHAIKDSDTVYVKPHGDQNYGDADYDIDYIYCDITDDFLYHPNKPCHFEHNCSHWKQGEKLF